MNLCLSNVAIPIRIPVKFCAFWLIILGGIVSCVSPDPLTELEPEEKDVYVTNRDQSVDFSQYKTYVIVDSVNVVSKNSGNTEDTVISGELILNTINAELQKMGFQKVNDPQLADVGISVSVLKFTEEVPAAYFPYLGGAGYYGYVSPAFFGFPGYAYAFPPYYGYYQVEVGSIAIEMFDLKFSTTANPNTLNAIWSALLAGSLADGEDDNGDRIVNAITAAFQQSPYLKDGK